MRMAHRTSGRDGLAQEPQRRMAHPTSGRQGFADMSITSSRARLRHHGIVCDHCSENPLTGIRFKCSTCPDFDLCQDCVEKNDTLNFHEENHIFFRLPVPVSTSEPGPAFVNRTSWIHEASCSSCAANPIVGFRFFCTQCGVSFCEFCEQSGASGHDRSHSLLKMGKPNKSEGFYCALVYTYHISLIKATHFARSRNCSASKVTRQLLHSSGAYTK